MPSSRYRRSLTCHLDVRRAPHFEIPWASRCRWHDGIADSLSPCHSSILRDDDDDDDDYGGGSYDDALTTRGALRENVRITRSGLAYWPQERSLARSRSPRLSAALREPRESRPVTSTAVRSPTTVTWRAARVAAPLNNRYARSTRQVRTERDPLRGYLHTSAGRRVKSASVHVRTT